MTNIHATCVAMEAKGVLLLGPSGSGKSDLALRLMHKGAVLVSDDQVNIASEGNMLFASTPPSIAGLFEIRGLGILSFPYCAKVQLMLSVCLTLTDELERLPALEWYEHEGVRIPQVRLNAFEGSAPLKVMHALTQRLVAA